TKFAVTMTTAIPADHAAPLPPRTPPATKATTKATGASGSTRRSARCSGSTLVTAPPPVPQIDDVDAAGSTEQDPDRQEHLVDPEEAIEQVADAPPGEHPRDQGRRDGPPGAHTRPGAVRTLVPGHERGQYMRSLSAPSKPTDARFRRSECRWAAARERFHERQPISLPPARASPSWRGPAAPAPRRRAPSRLRRSRCRARTPAAGSRP